MGNKEVIMWPCQRERGENIHWFGVHTFICGGFQNDESE